MTVFRVILATFAATLGGLILLPLLLPGLVLRIVAGLTRRAATGLEPRILPWGSFIEFEPVIGWKPKPNVDAHHLADDVFRAKTGADGWPGDVSWADSQVVVFGDSFAWGYGVDARDFFATIEQRIRIKAIGAAGYNSVQELLWMERLAPQLSGKLVVWFFYCGNDLYENLTPTMGAYRMPFVRTTGPETDDWEIVTRHISPARWPYTLEPLNEGRDYYGKLAELCTDGFLSQRAYGACEFLIRSARDICRNAGARLAVLTVPDQMQLHPPLIEQLRARVPDQTSFDPRRPDRVLGDICRRLEVDFVPGCERLDARHYKEHDCHWNEEGHRRVAELLAELYHEHTGPSVAPRTQSAGDAAVARPVRLDAVSPTHSRSRFTKPVAIVVPVTDRGHLTSDEEISLRHLRTFLGRYDRYLLKPPGTTIAGMEDFGVKPFGSQFFGSLSAHNRLLLSREFYEAFSEYRYILIYHLDALVFSDQLLAWCATDLDYIGAPWQPCADTPTVTHARSGNGGFSLRKVESFLRVMDSRQYYTDPNRYWDAFRASRGRAARIVYYPTKHLKRLRRFNGVRWQMDHWPTVGASGPNEDHFWSDEAIKYDPGFKVAPFDVALRFAFEVDLRGSLARTNGQLPFGCHAWPRYDRAFWEPYLLMNPTAAERTARPSASETRPHTSGPVSGAIPFGSGGKLAPVKETL